MQHSFNLKITVNILYPLCTTQFATVGNTAVFDHSFQFFDFFKKEKGLKTARVLAA